MLVVPYVVVARRGGRLVGPARQCRTALDRYRTVRQKVLLTDDEPGQWAFYESLGYPEVRHYGRGTLRAFVRIDG